MTLRDRVPLLGQIGEKAEAWAAEDSNPDRLLDGNSGESLLLLEDL